MSRLLGIAFDASEVGALNGFATSLEVPWDLLMLTGPDVQACGAVRAFLTGWTTLPPADNYADSMSSFASKYAYVAAASSMKSKDLLARVAGYLKAGMVTDAITIEGPNRFRRPILAGSAIATVQVDSKQIVLTFRAPAFHASNVTSVPSSEFIELALTPRSTKISEKRGGGKRPDLTQAKVVVTGGRPLKDAETFERFIGGLADALGGAVGATRAAVDNGFAPNELQVGQTGKIVAPDLYIAAGVSGSTQHMAGIKDSKVIVAVNKDASAPIFDVADVGIVADLFEVLPQLQKLVADACSG